MKWKFVMNGVQMGQPGTRLEMEERKQLFDSGTVVKIYNYYNYPEDVLAKERDYYLDSQTIEDSGGDVFEVIPLESPSQYLQLAKVH